MTLYCINVYTFLIQKVHLGYIVLLGPILLDYGMLCKTFTLSNYKEVRVKICFSQTWRYWSHSANAERALEKRWINDFNFLTRLTREHHLAFVEPIFYCLLIFKYVLKTHWYLTKSKSNDEFMAFPFLEFFHGIWPFLNSIICRVSVLKY